MKYICSLALLLFVCDAASAKSLPPLGKRKYLLDTRSPERPAQIEGIEAPASDLSAGIMKDPIPVGEKADTKKARAWQDPPRVVLKTSKMKFEKVAVGGRYSVPRVTFEPERKEIKHSDELVKHDYKKKVQDSEQILKDLNW
ncbi:MAG: hypothetical protein H7249_18745 [Chitinophagaceae bacterium]|nr:hypothetical protein [Oligoflexus sp.]